jgi:hypothetical protein
VIFVGDFIKEQGMENKEVGLKKDSLGFSVITEKID